MSKKINLKIITPEKLVLEELVDQVTMPTLEGEITVLPEHIPIIVGLKSGDIVAMSGGEHIPFAVSGGFVEVHPVRSREGSQRASTSKGIETGAVTDVVILADFAEHVADITDEAIAKAKAKSEELKKQMQDKGSVDFEHFEAELERSLTRVKIAEKWRTKKYRK